MKAGSESFSVSTGLLAEAARRMSSRISEGLAADGAELACIPTFVSIDRIRLNGRLLVLDLGGTNIRCAQVRLDSGKLVIEKGPVRKRLVPEGGSCSLGREEFLDRLADALYSLDPESRLPLGYCFSYPARSAADGDAVLLNWTKELFVKDTAGFKAGEMLVKRLSEGDKPIELSGVRVVNDTVAALLAGMAVSDADLFIGLIVGTGTNTAVPMDLGLVPKLRGLGSPGQVLPVNLESGNFRPPCLTPWDDALDAKSHNPGAQRLEKAVSGRYLADLLKLCMPESDIQEGLGAAEVFARACGSRSVSGRERGLAKQIVERSARLTAACLAGIISFMQERQGIKKVSIAAEGSVFRGHQAYRETVETALADVLTALGLEGLDFEFPEPENANLLGGAIAGLAG